MTLTKSAIKVVHDLFSPDFRDDEYPVWYDGLSIVITNKRILEYQGLVKLKLAFEVELDEVEGTEYKYNLKEYGVKLHLKSGDTHLIKNKLKMQFNGLNTAISEVRSGLTAQSLQLYKEVVAEAAGDKTSSKNLKQVMKESLAEARQANSERETKPTPQWVLRAEADAAARTSAKDEMTRLQVEKFAAETNWTKPLPKWVVNAITSNRIEDEPVKIILMGNVGYAGALVAFEDRCLIAKGGAMGSFMAGSLGGGRITTFYYDQITGIEYNSGLLSGVLEILTPSYQGTANKDYWKGLASGSKRNLDDNDPWKLSNTLPLNKDDYRAAKSLIDSLRKLIASYRRGGVAPIAQAAEKRDLSDELLKLADLRDKGILSDSEFTAAKIKLLEN